MKLYIIRHGETDWNKEGKFQGQTNIPLNKQGLLQASKLSNSLKDLHLDYIYSSPLDRAISTGKIVNKYHHAEFIINDTIVERYLGKLEGQKYTNYNLLDLWSHILNLNNREDSLYDVEPLEHMLNRAYSFLNYLIKTHKKNTNVNILISSHGSFILALLLVLGKIDKHIPLYEHKLGNCCCYTIENPEIHII